ncbi:phage tail tube protein [Auraticoccus monumenti]|uniref:Uncharacterized protein n=1 Tax=Auraticoccus monumenti TaxID=675864 RepID=A0A1G6UK31_9ACTN|nr:hypothetical protein [Auraticoccus monumenti]SDD40875.1 hypothetical protein SAMN04489747_0889 [Auraticoccus monumenti]
MTTYYPEGRPLGVSAPGKGSIIVAPATMTDRSAPTVTHFASPTGFAIHKDVVAWNPTPDVPMNPDNRYGDAEVVQEFGIPTWTIPDFTVVYDPQNPDSEEYQAYLKLQPGTVWEIFDRRGLPADLLVAVGQVGDLFQVEIGPVRRREQITVDNVQKLRSTLFVRLTQRVLQDIALA